MTDLLNCCRICLASKETNASLYLHVQQKYLPSVIENICGVVISSYDEPEALICNECADAIVMADDIIKRCQESHKLLQDQRRELLTAQERKRQNPMQRQQTKNDEVDEWLPHQCKKEQEEVLPEPEEEEMHQYTQNFFVEPEMLVESILENSSIHDNSELRHSSGSESKEKKIRKRRSRKKSKGSPEDDNLHCDPNPAALLYQSHFKTSKPKKSFIRNREQYLKRKIRNYPVKEPLTLIGGAGVIRKRKPKSYHRAIPNFYFRCELCHEFESNVASYAVTHLTSVHGIDRPAIFRCSQCDAKPFIKNQSLQEHIATIHEQQPKKRDFVCQECGKTFIKNCHLQKHLLSVHKLGEMPYKCSIPECGNKGYVDAYALRMHMKQTHRLDNEEQLESLTTLYQCDACDKSFLEMPSLNTHIKTTHPIEGYNCLQCGYNFRQKSRYETHVRRAKCKPPCYVCRYCERTFVKLLQLEEHQREMH